MSASVIARTSCRSMVSCFNKVRHFSTKHNNQNLHESLAFKDSLNQLEQRFQNLSGRVQALENFAQNRVAQKAVEMTELEQYKQNQERETLGILLGIGIVSVSFCAVFGVVELIKRYN